MTVPVQTITARELSLTGSFRFHAEFFTAVSLMRKRLIDVKPLITHTLASTRRSPPSRSPATAGRQ